MTKKQTQRYINALLKKLNDKIDHAIIKNDTQSEKYKAMIKEHSRLFNLYKKISKT